MKRNWVLIRAVLLDEVAQGWTLDEVNYHKYLCVDAGFLNAGIVSNMGQKSMQVMELPGNRLTIKGEEMAARLRNEDDLLAALKRLDDLGVGHFQEVVVELVERIQINRLRLPWTKLQ